MTTKIITLEME